MPLRIPLLKLATVGSLTALTGVAGFFGYQVVRSDLAAGVYRQRLADLVGEYESLRSAYNEAVRRTAVTELLVEGTTLSVRVRGADGIIKTVETPFDPSGEVYVDYVVIDGRLWIRRVFDANTPPSRATLIDPLYETVDWSDPGASVGKAVYRRLGEGCWVVTVTGNGSLGLVRRETNEPVNLVAAPPLKDFSALEKAAQSEAESIGLGEVWSWLTGGEPAPATR